MTDIYRQHKKLNMHTVSLHQDRMTVEDLRSKIDIAVELSVRDEKIEAMWRMLGLIKINARAMQHAAKTDLHKSTLVTMEMFCDEGMDIK